ncbi:MAG: 2-oxoacid:acceptor oxidoreductase family protein [Chloroflexi bacterium]|nr:2-oxoacid:acceptor oxidoreductase family protein [Chloroflexota bacterium]
MRTYNVQVCGVGGTGVMELGALLRQAAIAEGTAVVGLERRGSAQRGGGASSSARLVIREENETDDRRRAALVGTISFGQADLMIATEAVQALRNMHFLSEFSEVVLNNRAVKLVGLEYPDIDDVAGKLKEITERVRALDASQISMERFGSYRWTNPILLGVALRHTGLPLERETAESLLLREEEKEAFRMGLEYELESST